MKTIRALWGYRGFITGSVNREFQANYKNSILGATWSVIRPLTLIVVYTVVFSQVMQGALRSLGVPPDAPMRPVEVPGEGDEIKEGT